MREAYRTQKGLLTASGVDFLLAWSGKEIADYETVRSEVAAVLTRISKAAASASVPVIPPAASSEPVSPAQSPEPDGLENGGRP